MHCSPQLAQEDSNHHQLCNSKLTLDARILLFEPFDILITTLDAVELPGCVEAIPVLAGLGKRVITRGVDDPGTLASVIDTSSGGFVNAVITRDPEAIAPECEKARKARDAAMKARNSRRRKQ